jgi:hypothetical protein
MHHAYKTTDLAPDERRTVERLLGRPLQNDEAVEIIAHKVDEQSRALAIVDRKLAAAGILELAKGKSLGGATVRELIDEGRRF